MISEFNGLGKNIAGCREGEGLLGRRRMCGVGGFSWVTNVG
jgi:hypothetical protein